MPLLLGGWACVLFYGKAPQYWLIPLPLLLTLIFMGTLAEIRDEGHRILVNRTWNSMDVSKKEVVRIGHSFLEGIGVLELRRFVFPWGRIYFVLDWSKLNVVREELEGKSAAGENRLPSLVLAVLVSLAMAVSGFGAGWAMRSSVQDIRIQISAVRIVAFTLVGALCVLFAIARTRRPSFANVVLWVAGAVGGFFR